LTPAVSKKHKHKINSWIGLPCPAAFYPQAREAGGDELDDLVSAPRMVLQQYVDKWFPEDPEEVPVITERALKKLLLDVSLGGGG
jgi:hypothetical protein